MTLCAQGEDCQTILYANWLNMARAGLLALEFYTPESKKWRQAHMQARFGIMRVMQVRGAVFICCWRGLNLCASRLLGL